MKKSKVDWERGINALADAIPYGHLLASTDPLELLLSVARRIKELEAELDARDERRCETCRFVQDNGIFCDNLVVLSHSCMSRGFTAWEPRDVDTTLAELSDEGTDERLAMSEQKGVENDTSNTQD